MIRLSILSIFIILMSNACSNSNSKKPIEKAEAPVHSTAASKHQFSFNFTSPDVIVLEKALTEISGLAYDSNKDVLIAHNDEKGHVYEINKSDGSILADHKFGGKGDYESVEYLDGNYVIASSQGKLHFYDIITQKTRSIKTNLSSKNDLEGMCLSPDNQQLLLACKGQAREKSSTKHTKLVYAYDLKSNRLLDNPFLKINDQDLKRMVENKHSNESKSQLKSLINRVKHFSPSGIAIHPKTKEYYLISARGSLLIIIDKFKNLKEVVFLNENTNKQPEGISFDKNANLYISTEGHGLSAKIFKFTKR